ncbi:MAG: glucosaminidase domain-containing protein [Clostridiales bacterium]|nr:glucosaminidase domain-containing protein [Clostridiales bacterium]
MATTAQIKAFIEEIAPVAQKAYKTLGKVLPSVCIGMACVECAYGTAGSVKHHSYFGQKVGTGKTATKYWGGKFFTSKTSEEYTLGVHTTITSAFRAYDNMEQGVFNYYELLNTSLYSGVKIGTDYKTQMQQIKTCGYMTSSTEVNSVISIIEKYGLTQYDGQSSVSASISMTSSYTVGQNYTLQYNMYVRDSANGNKKKYLNLTANAKSNGYQDGQGYGILKKGTAVTCKAVEQIGSNVWIKIPSGWIAAYCNGTTYIK